MASLVGYEYSTPNPSVTQAQVNQLLSQLTAPVSGGVLGHPAGQTFSFLDTGASGQTGIFKDYTSAYSFLNALGQTPGIVDPFHQVGGKPSYLTPQSFISTYLSGGAFAAGTSSHLAGDIPTAPLGADAQQRLAGFPTPLNSIAPGAPISSQVSKNLFQFAAANNLQTGANGAWWFGDPVGQFQASTDPTKTLQFASLTGQPSLTNTPPPTPPNPFQDLPQLPGNLGTGGLPPGSTIDPTTGQITLPAGSTIPLSLDPLLSQYFSALNSNLANFSSQLNAFGGSIHDQLLNSFPELGQLSQFLTSSFQNPVPQDLLSSFTESLRNAQIARGFDAGAGPSLAEATAVTNLAEQRRLNLIPALQQLGTSLVGMSGLAGPQELGFSAFSGAKATQTSQQLQYAQQQQQAQQFQQTQALAQQQFKFQQTAYEDSLKAAKEQSAFAKNEYLKQQQQLDAYMKVQQQIADAPRQKAIAQLTASSVATSNSQANLPGWVQGIEDTYGVSNAIASAVAGQNAYRDYLINHPYMV